MADETHSETDPAEPHDPGDVVSPRLLKRLSFRRSSSTPFSEEEKENQAIFQTRVLVVAAGILLVLVWVLLDVGYGQSRSVPATYYVPSGVVIFVGGLTGFAEIWMAVFWSLGRRLIGKTEAPAPKGIEGLRQWRQRWQPRLVYMLTAITAAGFIGLVLATGLAIESPYIPLVTAPAVFGPFVAREGSTVGALLLIVGAILIMIALWLPPEACDGCLSDRDAARQLIYNHDPRARQLGRELADTETRRPKPVVFVTVGFVFLTIAGLISIGRLQTERELKRSNLALATDRDHLARHRLQLYELAVRHDVAVPEDIADDLEPAQPAETEEARETSPDPT